MDSIGYPQLLLRYPRPDILDIRSSSAFQQGHIPGARSLPLPKDPQVASRLLENSSASLQQRVLCQGSPMPPETPMVVYCQTGTWRSQVFCQLFASQGHAVTGLAGGYRAFQQWRDSMLRRPLRLRVVGGKTGTGKTEYLRTLAAHGEQIIDLEELAQHRGSVFGQEGGLAKTREQFLNDLAKRIQALEENRVVWVEDKGRSLGRAGLPEALWQQMQAAPMVLLTAWRAQRLETLLRKYRPLGREALLQGVRKIRARLGAEKVALIERALAQDHFMAAAELLLEYYDTAYELHLQGRMVVQTQAVHEK